MFWVMKTINDFWKHYLTNKNEAIIHVFSGTVLIILLGLCIEIYDNDNLSIKILEYFFSMGTVLGFLVMNITCSTTIKVTKENQKTITNHFFFGVIVFIFSYTIFYLLFHENIPTSNLYKIMSFSLSNTLILSRMYFQLLKTINNE